MEKQRKEKRKVRGGTMRNDRDRGKGRRKESFLLAKVEGEKSLSTGGREKKRGGGGNSLLPREVSRGRAISPANWKKKRGENPIRPFALSRGRGKVGERKKEESAASTP